MAIGDVLKNFVAKCDAKTAKYAAEDAEFELRDLHCGTNGDHYCPNDLCKPDAEEMEHMCVFCGKPATNYCHETKEHMCLSDWREHNVDCETCSEIAHNDSREPA